MIFATIGEELGILGCFIVLALFVLLFIRILKAAKTARDPSVSYICVGLFGMFASQVIINIGMCLELLPVIGITLPFLSAGGSSNLTVYLAVGLLLNVKRFHIENSIVDFRVKNIRTPFNA